MAPPAEKGTSVNAWKRIGRHGHSIGTFSVDQKGIKWRSNEDDGSTMLAADSLKLIQWTVFGKRGYLRVTTSVKKSSSSSSSSKQYQHRFNGFQLSDFDSISKVMKENFNLTVKEHTMSSAGYSFGKADVNASQLVFRQCVVDDEEEEGQDGDEMLTLDLNELSQCVLPGNNRNEIELQFHESDTVEQGTDQCIQMRFFVPPDADADPDAPTNAELFQQRIMTEANIKSTTGDVIVQFDEKLGTFLTPRGRYIIELYDSFLRLRGNKYDYKIKYDDVYRLFLLPKPDGQKAFVISLDKPIRQGQQKYQHLVLQTSKEIKKISILLDEETLEREYNGALKPIMSGPLDALIATTFKVITKKKVIVSDQFKNSYNHACVKCALRANEGHLYPLEKTFIFIHKPAVLIRFSEIEQIEFQRYAGGQGSTRNFDLCVTLRSVSDDISTKQEYIFSGIDRSDYKPLHNFLSGKKVKIVNIDGPGTETSVLPVFNEEESGNRSAEGEAGMAESSEDEDYDGNQGSESSDESEVEEDEDMASIGTDEDLEDARKRNELAKVQKSEIKQKKIIIENPKKVEKKRPIQSDGNIQSKKKKMSITEKDNKNDSATKKTQGKTKKDPNAPKKPTSAYMFFTKHNRSKVVEDNPKSSFAEIAKLVSESYKTLTEEGMKKYQDMANKDKERYKKEMASYVPTDSPEDKKSGGKGNDKKSGKAKKDPNAPKKPLNVYAIFCQRNRSKVKDENENANFSELSKLLSLAYKSISDEEKKICEAEVKKDKARYAKEMEEYNSKESKKVEEDKAESEDESGSGEDTDDSDSDSDDS